MTAKLLGVAPSGATDAATKGYVDTNFVNLTTNQSIAGTKTFSGPLITGNSLAYAVASKTANYTLASTDNVILASAASTSITMTLPTAVGIAGVIYTIKRTDSTYANTVTIATTSSQTIDGATTYTNLIFQYMYVQVISDGANWQIIDSGGVNDPWHNATLLNSWTNAGGTTYSLQYRFEFPDRVAVRGNIVPGTVSSGIAVMTAPVGYRPATNPTPAQPVYTAGGTLVAPPSGLITTGGNVQLYNLPTAVTGVQLNLLISIAA